jgi:hypothetical protein
MKKNGTIFSDKNSIIVHGAVAIKVNKICMNGT